MCDDADNRPRLDEYQSLLRDKARLDWLADVTQSTGLVRLPSECVEKHLDSLRAAIDCAMEMDK
jgi:hypothetical protein